MEEIRMKTYKGSGIATLGDLQRACRFDETTNVRLTLVAARRGDNNEQVTFVNYQDDDNVQGKLVFLEYQDNLDYSEKLLARVTGTVRHLFDGTAHIKDRIAKIMIFRDSAA